ncbi:unnamed protein product [Caenorhabditis auriculariae]|uniref:G-protein coupled receptors family 1 profile domain-containing protein n=1 Tax=Caenorhabditis auriculariae TaxID=2777116 RepID=A0A8S1H2P6_9PELO|nr:unnamed protein product [Caenorhabditis auriculariae]
MTSMFFGDFDYEDLGMIMNVEDIDKYCPRGISRNDSEQIYMSTPFNDKCLQTFFQRLQTSLRRFNPWEEILYTTVYIIISVLAVIGNGLVILAVVRKKTMRTNRNVLILNLAFSNLILALINIPFLWLPSIDFEFPYSRFFCKFANVLPGSNIYCSTFTISVMAIDRYYSVKRLKVASNREQCVRAVAVSVFIWVLSFILSLPLLLYYDTAMLYVMKDIFVFDDDGGIKMRSYGWRQCRLSATRSSIIDVNTQRIQFMMSVLQVVFLYAVPLFVLSIFNVKLTRFLKTNANQMSRSRGNERKREGSDTNRPTNEVSCTLKMQSNLRSPSMPSIRSSIAERASNRRTSRTTSLLIAMAGSYAALWLPFTLISFLLDLDLLNDESYVALVERIDQTCKMVSMLSICVNPFLYGFLNTNFRHEFTEIYYRFVRCQTKRREGNRFTHDFSSLAGATRNNSLYTEDQSLVTALRRSIRGSAQKLRASMRSELASPRGFRQIAVGPAQSATEKLADRIVLDDDVDKDSFVTKKMSGASAGKLLRMRVLVVDCFIFLLSIPRAKTYVMHRKFDLKFRQTQRLRDKLEANRLWSICRENLNDGLKLYQKRNIKKRWYQHVDCKKWADLLVIARLRIIQIKAHVESSGMDLILAQKYAAVEPTASKKRNTRNLAKEVDSARSALKNTQQNASICANELMDCIKKQCFAEERTDESYDADESCNDNDDDITDDDGNISDNDEEISSDSDETSDDDEENKSDSNASSTDSNESGSETSSDEEKE